MSGEAEQRKLAAIMFTDMVRYSALSRRDDKLALELLEEPARLGDNNGAIATLQHLVTIPYIGWFGVPLTPALLRLDPDWDNLRADPGFQKLLAGKELVGPNK